MPPGALLITPQLFAPCRKVKLRGINRAVVDWLARSLNGLKRKLKVKGWGCLCGGEGVRRREKCCVDSRRYIVLHKDMRAQ
jgi:hypothetical protein